MSLSRKHDLVIQDNHHAEGSMQLLMVKLTKRITLAYVKAQLKSAIYFHNICKWGRHLYFATHTKTTMCGLMDG